jgi:hypothetical protein
LLYRRKAWEAHPFAANGSVDTTDFVAHFDLAKIRIISDPNFYIALLHKGNTIARNVNSSSWHRQPINQATELLGQDREFYVRLRNGPTAAPVDLRHRFPVSCIMPTYNRRAFVSQSIRYFLRQDYPQCELIIMDDGEDPVHDLIPTHPSIRYVRLSERQSIGEKRNKACELADGKIIVFWDDDDWYAPNRISYQVKSILEGRFDITCLHNSLMFWFPTRQFWGCTPELHNRMFLRGIHGGTIALSTYIACGGCHICHGCYEAGCTPKKTRE